MPDTKTINEFLERRGLTLFDENRETGNFNFQTSPYYLAPLGVEAFWDGHRSVAFKLPLNPDPVMVFKIMAGADGMTYSGTDGAYYIKFTDGVVIEITLEW